MIKEILIFHLFVISSVILVFIGFLFVFLITLFIKQMKKNKNEKQDELTDAEWYHGEDVGRGFK